MKLSVTALPTMNVAHAMRLDEHSGARGGRDGRRIAHDSNTPTRQNAIASQAPAIATGASRATRQNAIARRKC